MLSALLTVPAANSASPRPARVAVFTPGLNFAPVLEGLREGLAKRGYREGTDLVLLVEDTKGWHPDLERRAAKVVETKPDVLVSVATAHTAAAKRATPQIPIVFVPTTDPTRAGLVAGFASSKNNLTGISSGAETLGGKRLALLQKITPTLKRVLVFVDPADRAAETSFEVLKETAGPLQIELIRHTVAKNEDVAQALAASPRGSFDAIFHLPSVLVSSQMNLLIQRAKEDRVPLSVSEPGWVAAGALTSYGADFRLMGTQAAGLVAKVLQGTAPADIPIELPGDMLLAINLATARTIEVKIPRYILERADRVYQ